MGTPLPYDTPDEPAEITDDDLSFLASYTRSRDLSELRHKVYDVWRATKKQCWVYKCIQDFMFLHTRIDRHFYYPHVVDPSAPTQALLDVGCCFGTDTRKLMQDGFLDRDLLAIDIVDDYWKLGLELFQDKATMSVPTAFGDMTTAAFCEAVRQKAETLANPLGYVWAGAVLHVLTKEDVEALIRNVEALLSPQGTFFGTCVGREPAGSWAPAPSGKGPRFLHSKSSLEGLLRAAGFADVDIRSGDRRAMTGQTQKEGTTEPSLDEDGRCILVFKATKGAASGGDAKS